MKNNRSACARERRVSIGEQVLQSSKLEMGEAREGEDSEPLEWLHFCQSCSW